MSQELSGPILSSDIDELTGEMNPLVSLHNTIVFSSNDWGSARDFAWLWGIVVGWDLSADELSEDEEDTAMDELAAKFNWSAGDVARLRNLHAQYAALMMRQL